MFRLSGLALFGALVAAISMMGTRDADAGPMCSTLGGTEFSDFTSCVGSGQDTLSAVQTILDTINNAPTLTGGYYPGQPDPTYPKTADEFSVSTNGVLEFTPVNANAATNTYTFTFILGTIDFISLKQAGGFEVFFVGGLCDGACNSPVVLTHMVQPNTSTSHISAFFSDFAPPPPPPPPPDGVPEPSALLFLSGGLLGLGAAARRRKNK